jgi:hypothetical protein
LALRTEAPQRDVAAVDDSIQVYIHGPHVIGDWDLLEPADGRHARVVEPDVDAPEPPLRRLGERLHGFWATDVGG